MSEMIDLLKIELVEAGKGWAKLQITGSPESFTEKFVREITLSKGDGSVLEYPSAIIQHSKHSEQ